MDWLTVGGGIGLFAVGFWNTIVSRRTHRSVGPANGVTLHELLERIVALEEYQHTRNHDFANALQRNQGRLMAVADDVSALRTDVARLADWLRGSPPLT